MSTSFSIRNVTANVGEQFLTKMTKTGIEYWLWAMPITGNNMRFVLKDKNGTSVWQWEGAGTRAAIDILNKQGYKKMTTESKQQVQEESLTEDHFTDEEIRAIKNCPDDLVHRHFKRYRQSEALGDTNRANVEAKVIRDRCTMLGHLPVSESSDDTNECGGTDTNREVWESRMKQAGATMFESDEGNTVVTAFKEVGKSRFGLGTFDLASDEEIFESLEKSELYSKYTMAGDQTLEQLWTEYVLAEGATEIKTVNDAKVAFLGESRLGKFIRKVEKRPAKRFEDMLAESMNMTMTMDTTGNQTLTVTADGEDADALASMLQLSGVRHDEPCGCGEIEVEEDFANEPDVKGVDAETQLNKMSGGLNRQKRQVNPNNMGDNPLAMRRSAKAGAVNVEEGKIAESLSKEFEKFSPVAESAPQITARKYRGDDDYSWAVFINDRPAFTGLSRTEVPYYKKRAAELAAERGGDVSSIEPTDPYPALDSVAPKKKKPGVKDRMRQDMMKDFKSSKNYWRDLDKKEQGND